MRNIFLIFCIFAIFSHHVCASNNIASYNDTVRKNPYDWHARYELAKKYFENQQYSAAQYNFEFLTAQCDAPREILDEINTYLSIIRHKKKWDTEFGIGAIPDASINYTPSNRNECVNTINGLACAEIEDPTSGIGLQINGAVNHFIPISKNIGIRTTFGGAILNISDNIPTDYSAHIAIGPRYIFSHGDIYIQPSFGARMYDNHFYNTAYGIRVGSTIQFPHRVFSSIGLDIQRTHYHNPDVNNILSGYDWTFYIHPKYYLNDFSFISLTTAISHNDTKLSALGADIGRIAIGYFQIFPYGFNFYINAMYSHTSYHTTGTFLIDNEFHTTTRHDNIYQIYTRIYNSYINIKNFIPALSYTYTIQESNIPTYDRQTHQIMAEIVRMF